MHAQSSDYMSSSPYALMSRTYTAVHTSPNVAPLECRFICPHQAHTDTHTYTHTHTHTTGSPSGKAASRRDQSPTCNSLSISISISIPQEHVVSRVLSLKYLHCTHKMCKYQRCTHKMCKREKDSDNTHEPASPHSNGPCQPLPD